MYGVSECARSAAPCCGLGSPRLLSAAFFMITCYSLVTHHLTFNASFLVQVLMATNRIDILDSALLRPGRIDRKIEFPNPSESSRVDILRIHSRKMNLTRGIDLKRIADKMSGASGAELKACCTEAGMFALRERRVHVTQEDFEMSVAKVSCGCLVARSSLWGSNMSCVFMWWFAVTCTIVCTCTHFPAWTLPCCCC
jgi:SpoVK/Ycf46/Vps4 family AAA+-type ATPase